jgi:hypothetical protein
LIERNNKQEIEMAALDVRARFNRFSEALNRSFTDEEWQLISDKYDDDLPEYPLETISTICLIEDGMTVKELRELFAEASE